MEAQERSVPGVLPVSVDDMKQDGGDNGVRYRKGRPVVTREFKGSLVQYPPEEKVVGKWEQRIQSQGGRISKLLVWRAAIIELVASAGNTFVSTSAVTTIRQNGYTPISRAVGLVHFPILTLFILASAAASGGHINPSITVSTMIAGLTTPARAMLYVPAQVLGAILGASLLRGILPVATQDAWHLGACMLKQALPLGPDGALQVVGLSTGSGILSEAAFTFMLLFVAFGVALDPKQRQVFGPILAPFIIGATLGLLLFVSGGLQPGYTGAGMNPARCFGPAVAIGHWDNQWVYWVGPLIGCFLLGMLYRLIPPHHVVKYQQEQQQLHKRMAPLDASHPAQNGAKV
eukprot:jgi/Chlat1/7450/Chrsp6S07497